MPEGVSIDVSANERAAERLRLRRLDVQRLPEYRDRLFRAACALCGSREDAEDLVQETYASVLKRPRFVRRQDDLAYLTQVLRNTWINLHRNRVRRPQTVPFDESIDFVIDLDADPGVSIVEQRAIYQAIHELSPVLRDTLIAVDVVGLSYKQAARVLDTPQGTIMSRLYRARDQVAARLEGSAKGSASSLEPEPPPAAPPFERGVDSPRSRPPASP
jgi:RNA polymerase sigma-70 factor, ECF subfamily